MNYQMEGSVNTVALSESASDIRVIANRMKDIYSNVDGFLREIASNWDSASAQQSYAKFNSFSAKFEEFYNLIVKHSDAINASVAVYNEAEKIAGSESDYLAG